ncbi:MAG: HlyD family efflux transporter periplasmic adaptor subunit [Planctomycetota bacterium]|nr:HlyD family efflux transporter periplasmic adaptor subunit [Planctomycetota bacterium]
MTEETIDPSLLEQTKTQIRKLVAEIADLAESDVQPNEFYSEFLSRAVAAVASNGGAFWMLDGRGTLKLQHHIEFQQTGLMDGRARTQPHDALLGCMLQATGAMVIPPNAVVDGVPNAGNPTPFALFIAPVMLDKQCVGLVEIMMDPTRRAAADRGTQKSTLRFLGDLADLAASYLKNRQMRQVMSQQKLWNQLEGFTHQIHASLDLRETAYAGANDGKRLVGCDRVSVGLKFGGRVMIEAVSGQEVVEHRANLIRELTKLCQAVIKSGEDLVYTGVTDGFPPEIRDCLEIYVDESGAKTVIVTLLHKPESDPKHEKVPFGCVISEQIGDELPPTDAHARTEVVARHASTALWNAYEHDKIFMLPVLKALGSPWKVFRGRMLLKILAVFAAVLLVIGAMTFVPWELTIEGRGALLPEARRITYAPLDGIVTEVPVEHGDIVHKGDLLAKMDSPELQRELKRLMGERESAATQYEGLLTQLNKAIKEEDRIDIKAQRAEAQIKARSAKEQIEIIREQLKEMEIRAPQDGVVTTWEAKKTLLKRPVKIGQELISIAAIDGEWVLEVEVPDQDMGPIHEAERKLKAEIEAGRAKVGAALPAYFVTATDPEHRYHGFVRRIAANAEPVEQKHVVKMSIGFNDDVRVEYLKRNHDLRPGAEVRARIECGNARLAYVLFRDVVHVFYETVMFRWPFLN